MHIRTDISLQSIHFWPVALAVCKCRIASRHTACWPCLPCTPTVQNWLKALKNDKKLIVTASGRAEKAIKMILNIKEDKKDA